MSYDPDDEIFEWNDDDPESDETDEDENIEEIVRELRDEVEGGQFHQRSELALGLIKLAWRCSEIEEYERSIESFDEAIALSMELLDEGQIEFRYSLAKAMLHRALVMSNLPDDSALLPKGGYFGEISRVIGFLEEIVRDGECNSRDDLAIALMCASDYYTAKLKVSSTALSYQDRAISIWREMIEEGELEHRLSLVTALRSRGDTLREIGDAGETLRSYLESEQIAREMVEEGNPAARTSVLKTIMKRAEVLGNGGKYDAAQDLYLDALELCRVLSEEEEPEVRNWLPFIHVDRARLYRLSASYEDALKAFEQAIFEYERIDKTFEENSYFSILLKERIAQVQMDRGCMLHILNRYGEAKEAFNESMKLFQDPLSNSDNRYEISLVELNLASLLSETGDYEKALEIQKNAISSLENLDLEGHETARLNTAKAFAQKGSVLMALGLQEDAEIAYGDSIAKWKAIIDEGMFEHRDSYAYSYIVRANFYHETGELEKSIDDIRAALAIRRELLEDGERGALESIPPCHFLLARAFEEGGDIEAAISEFEEARTVLRKIHSEGGMQVYADIYWTFFRELEIMMNASMAELLHKKCDEAIEFHKLVLSEGYDAFYEEGPTFTVYHGHAACLEEKFEKAIEYYLDAIEMWKNTIKLREEEPVREENEPFRKRRIINSYREIERCYSCIAAMYENQSRHENSCEYYEKQAEINRVLIELGESVYNEFLVGALCNRAVGLESLERFEEAKRLFEDAIEISSVKTDDGKHHVYTDARLRSLAQFTTFMARRGEPVEKYIDEIIQLYEEIIESGNPYSLQLIGMCISGHAEVLASKEMYSEAAGMNRKVIAAYEAIPDFEKNHKLYSDLAIAYYNLGICLVNEGKIEKAYVQTDNSCKIYRALYEAGIESMLPEVAGCYDLLGSFSRDLCDFEDALSRFGAAVEIYDRLYSGGKEECRANIVWGLRNIAFVYQEQGKLLEAIGTYESIDKISGLLEEDDSEERTRNLLASGMRRMWLFKKLGDTKKAIEVSDEVFSVLDSIAEPGEEIEMMKVDALMARGFVECDAKSYDKGGARYAEAIEILEKNRNDNREARLNMFASRMSVGVCKMYSGDAEGGLVFFEKLLLMLDELETDESVHDFEGTLGMLFTNRADAFERLGRFKEAIESADRAIVYYERVRERGSDRSIRIQLAEVHLYRARALGRSGDVEAAISQCNQGIEILEECINDGWEYVSPELAELLFERSLWYERNNRKDEADEDLRRAEKILYEKVHDQRQEQWTELLEKVKGKR